MKKLSSFMWRIFEKISPIITVIGVVMIPVTILWVSHSSEKAKQQQEKAVRAQEAVKNYQNQLSTIFLKEDLEKNKKLRRVATATTLALLRDPNLDGRSKGQVITYLSEMKLIQVLQPAKNINQEDQWKVPVKEDTPIISLEGADLSKADLFKANFRGADLREANLIDADISGANLDDAKLYKANLFRADFTRADLTRADLSQANLTRANLTGANLSNTHLYGASLRGASLRGAYLYKTKLRGADLYGADLRDAKYCEVTLPDGTKNNKDCKEYYQ